MTKRIYADLQKTDGRGRVLLTTVGTRRDLEETGVELKEGIVLSFYSDDMDEQGKRDDLLFEGTVAFDKVADRWVAVVDWDQVRHESDLRAP